MAGRDGPAVVLTVILGVTLWRTFLVVDALRGRSGLVSRASRRLVASSASEGQRSPLPPKGRRRAGTGSGSFIRHWLVSMHVAAALAQAAGVAKYLVPVSDTSCRITGRAMVAFVLLYDASLVAFLLTKVAVTNGSRALACWEKGIVWGSRAYAWILLPVAAVFVAFAYPGYADDEEEFCFSDYGGDGDVYTWVYISNNFLLIIEFILLLGLFVKPMLASQQNTQSGGEFYLRIVKRNMVCTASISAAYIVATVVVVAAHVNKNPGNNKSAVAIDLTRSVKRLLALCLTELSMPLGFTSCWRECFAGWKARRGGADHTKVVIELPKTDLGSGARSATGPRVLPLQNPPV
eukprot:g17656.t1